MEQEKLSSQVYQGFANRMRAMAASFYRVGSVAANDVDTGFKNSLNLIPSIDLDSVSQPVIRPVMDLTDVKMGVDTIASMFNGNQYALGIASSLPTNGLLTNKNIAFNNSITVDGAQNPKEFADEFVQELEIQARTM